MPSAMSSAAAGAMQAPADLSTAPPAPAGATALIRRALAAAEEFREASSREARELARRTMWSAYREWTQLWFPSMTAAELDAAAARFEAGIVEVYG